MRRIGTRKPCALLMIGLLIAGAGVGSPVSHAQSGGLTPIQVRLHLTEAGEVEIRWEMQTFHLPMMLQAEAIASRGGVPSARTSKSSTSSSRTSAARKSTSTSKVTSAPKSTQKATSSKTSTPKTTTTKKSSTPKNTSPPKATSSSAKATAPKATAPKTTAPKTTAPSATAAKASTPKTTPKTTASPKPAETKAAETKPIETKPAETKRAETKIAETKPPAAPAAAGAVGGSTGMTRELDIAIEKEPEVFEGTATGDVLIESDRVGSSGGAGSKGERGDSINDGVIEADRDLRDELGGSSAADQVLAEREGNVFDSGKEPGKGSGGSSGSGLMIEESEGGIDLRPGSGGDNAGAEMRQTAMELAKQLPLNRRFSEHAVRQMVKDKVWADSWKSTIADGMRPKQMKAKIVKSRNHGMNNLIPELEIPRPILTFGEGGRYYAGAYTDRNVLNGQTYSYRVQLYDAQGSKIGQSDFVEIQVHDGIRPDAVPGIEVEPDDTSIEIRWQGLNDPEVAGYRVFRFATNPGEGSIGSRGEFVATKASTSSATTKSSGNRFTRTTTPDKATGSASPKPKQSTTTATATGSMANQAVATQAAAAQAAAAQTAAGKASDTQSGRRMEEVAAEKIGGSGIDLTDAVTESASGPGDLMAEGVFAGDLAMKFDGMQAWNSSPAIQMAVPSSYLMNPGMFFQEPIAEVSPDVRSFVDRDADPKMAYDYRVVAYDTHSGNGGFGQPHVAQLPDTDPPSAARNVDVTAAPSGGVVKLDWQSSRSSDVTSYRLFRRTDGGTPVPIRIVESKVRQAEDQLDPYSPSTFSYVVYAYDAAGNASPATESSGVRLPDIRPPAPPAITAIEVGDARVELRWTAPPDPDVDRFRVYRQKLGTSPETLAGNVKARNFVDTTGKLGAKYVYWVTAVDQKGNESAPSKAFEQRYVGTIDAQPPASVTVATKAGRKTITWAKDNRADGTTYLVLRAKSLSGEFQPVSGALYDSTFVDRSAGDENYYYHVVARYYTGDVSKPSAVVSAGGGSNFSSGGR